MCLWPYKSFVFAAFCITKMNSTISFFLTNCIAAELLFCLFGFVALYFSMYCAASAMLINYNLTIKASTFMTYFWALVTTREFFLTWHTAAWNWVFTSLSLVFSDHHELIPPTWTSFLKLWCLFAWSTWPFMTIFFTFMKSTV